MSIEQKIETLEAQVSELTQLVDAILHEFHRHDMDTFDIRKLEYRVATARKERGEQP